MKTTKSNNINPRSFSTIWGFFILFFLSLSVYAQQDSRYDAGLNLPFNEKAGDTNPQSGNVTVSEADVNLPGRAGFDFSYARIWALNQSNVFTMYRDTADGRNRLSGETIEKYNRMGVGWNSNIPYIYKEASSGTEILNLFFNGNVYEIDSSGIGIYNPNKSNLVGYDLLDLRAYRDGSIAYSDSAADFMALAGDYGVTDAGVDRSAYILYLKDNEQYYFRADGRLLMGQDRTGENRIWYFYDSESRVRVVLDSIGRKIRFGYDGNGNLGKIVWDVEMGVKGPDGVRSRTTVTKSVTYSYESAEGFSEIAALKGNVIGYRIPYVLIRSIDPMGHTTKYEYGAVPVEFTYDSGKSVSGNVYVVLEGISEIYTEDGKYRDKRSFEYEMPAKGPYTKWFYGGFMQYCKISREYRTDRHGKILNDTLYTYHDNNEAGNYNQYTAVIQMGNVKTTYTYSLSDEKNKNQVLDTLFTESGDGFRQLTDYVYNADRTKALDEVYRQGTFAYREKYQYDGKGNLKRFEDRQGLVTIAEYDDKYSIPVKTSKLVTVEGVTKSYDSEARIDALGQVVKEIVYLEGPDGTKRAVETANYAYDNYGNVTEKTDALSNTTHFVYDAFTHSFLVKIWQEVSIASWSTGTVHENWQNDPVGVKKVAIRSWKVYNGDGSLWLEIDNEGYAKEHYYDLAGAEIEVVNPDSDDERGFAQPIDPGMIGNDFDDFSLCPYLGSFLSSRANNPGARLEIDYENDYVRTEADLDKSRGEVKVTGKQGNGTGLTEKEIEYGANGTEYSVKAMEYDDLGRMISLTDPDAGGASVAIRVNGSDYARHDKTWIVKYDDLGRKVKVLYPDTAAGRSDIKQMSYNDAENSVTTEDPDGRKAYERRDWNGNVVEVKGLGNRTTVADDVQTMVYRYDKLNRKVQYTDAKGIVTEYRYDERNLVVEESYGEGTGSDLNQYDDRGNLVRRMDRKGQVIEFIYDELGRNTRAVHYKSAADYASKNVDHTVAMSYDNRGNAVRIANQNLIEHYVYDYGTRVTKVERRIKDPVLRSQVATVYGGDPQTQVLGFEYSYNDSGLVKEMKYPDGSTHRFSYDSALGRLARIDEGGAGEAVEPFVTDLAYNKTGVVTRMSYRNGTIESWEFDNRKRTSRIRIDSGAQNVADLKYTLSGSGDILGINDNSYAYDGFDRIVGAETLIPGNVDRLKLVREHFGTTSIGNPIDEVKYDAQADFDGDGEVDGRDLLAASRDDLSAKYDMESFAYDRNGNRTELAQNGDAYTYEYGIQNRLARIWKQAKGAASKSVFVEYLYDANGNTIKRTVYRDDNGKDITDYAYDTMNRLVTTTTNGRTTEYRYDNAGNRFAKISDKGIEVYLRHGQLAVAMDIEIAADESGKAGKINRYVLSGELVAGRVTTVVNRDGTRDMKKSWYQLDHLNSTKCVTDGAGKLEVMYEYRAFGEQLKRLDTDGKDPGDAAKYSYGGKELDSEIGLYYFNARFYDASIGRFISVDPVQDGTNWYVYCADNPLGIKDPTGLKLVELKVGNTKVYVDEKIKDKFNDFMKALGEIKDANDESIKFSINNSFRPSLQQAHFHAIKHSTEQADKDDLAKHGIKKGVNPVGESYHEIGLAVDITFTGELAEDKQKAVVDAAKKSGFYKMVATEAWHFGYAGSNPGDSPTEESVDKNALAKELGYTDFDTMYKEDQKDYVDKGNPEYKCQFGNTTGLK